jgi:N-acyl-D-aspartate/D-glutamate deacylase
MRLLADPDERRRLGELAAEPHTMRHFTHWDRMVVFHTVAPENERFRGRTLGDVADELGTTPWDALCDISLADGLATSFGHPAVDEPDATWAARVRVWRDQRAVIGASDAGAHYDMFFSADYATKVLGEAVAKRHLLPLEEAVHLLAAVPAELYRLVDRGRVVEGAFADLVVLDEQHVGSNPMEMRTDLPGGAARLYAEANGIHHVLCNGVEIVRDGEFTPARPGVVLRSGRDTR